MNLCHYADMLAIPFFFLMALYFYKKRNRTFFENILLLFAVSGLILDSYFSYYFLK